MIRDERETPEVLARETPFEGMVWDVARERFRYGGEELAREFVDHTGAVAILALDDEDRVLLIRQYRHPVRLRAWELPAGLLDEPGEEPLDAAKRELAEEADQTAREWRVLADYATTPGGSTETIRIYLARGLERTSDAFARTAEEADIEVRWTPLDEAVEAVLAGALHNPSAIIGVLAAKAERERGWSGLRDADAPWPTRSPGRGRSR